MNCPTLFSPSQAVPVAAVLPPRATRPLRPLRSKVLVILNGDNGKPIEALDQVGGREGLL